MLNKKQLKLKTLKGQGKNRELKMNYTGGLS